MNGIKHHISDDLLMGYAAGALPQAFDLVVATHVSLSDDARARLAGFEELGGVVLSDMEEAELAEDSLEQTLARIAGTPVRRKSRSYRRTVSFPAPLRKIVGGDEGAVKWRSLGTGAKQCVLHNEDGVSARLLYIPAGQAMPEHGHRGMELTLGAQGRLPRRNRSFRARRRRIRRSGHGPHPGCRDGEDCICLVATDQR
jgi:putative transcriptional regulator